MLKTVKATGLHAIRVVVRATQLWWQAGATQLGAVIAFYCIFALAPLLVVGVVIAGHVLGEHAARGQLVEHAAAIIGVPAAQMLETLIVSTWQSPSSITATVLSLGTLLVGASGLVVELRNALHAILKPPARVESAWISLIRARLRALILVLGFGALLVCSLLLTTLVTAMTEPLRRLFGDWVDLSSVIDVGISIILLGLGFAAVLRTVPDHAPPWRAVWIGALASALLFVAGKYGVGFYLGSTGVSSTYGAAGALVVLIVWLYFSALSLLWGAAVGHEAHQSTLTTAGRPPLLQEAQALPT